MFLHVISCMCMGLLAAAGGCGSAGVRVARSSRTTAEPGESIFRPLRDLDAPVEQLPNSLLHDSPCTCKNSSWGC